MKRRIFKIVIMIVVALVAFEPVFMFVDRCIERQISHTDPIYGMLMFPLILGGVTWVISNLIDNLLSYVYNK